MGVPPPDNFPLKHEDHKAFLDTSENSGLSDV